MLSARRSERFERAGALETLRPGCSGKHRLHRRDGICGDVRDRCRHAARYDLLRRGATLVSASLGHTCSQERSVAAVNMTPELTRFLTAPFGRGGLEAGGGLSPPGGTRRSLSCMA